MRQLITFILWGITCAQNIYLSDINKNNNNGLMHLKLDTPNIPQTVYIMSNPNDNTLATEQWKRRGEFVMNCNEADIMMSSFNLERSKYYAFMIDDAGNHYTKPVYLDRDGEWQDPATSSDKIAADKQKTPNGITDMFGEGMSMTAINFLISHALSV